MMFLHPWAIVIGLAAATGPIWIHWLTRPRPVRMPLSTLRFVREAVRQRRGWHRLRDLLLLSLRMLAVLLIALAFARPQYGQRLLVSGLQGGNAVRVVILDVSLSMAAREGAVEQMERARTAAANHLRYQPGLAANLILAGARPHGVFDGPSTNFDALRRELAGCRALPQRMDVNRALELAASMLATTAPSDRHRRELVVVSDFQRTTWAKADFSPLPADTQIQLESIAPAKPPENLAILRVEGRSAGSAGGMQLAVEVGNYSSATRKITVEVVIGTSIWRLSGTFPSGRSTTLTKEIGFRIPGWHVGEARLLGVDDALAADNVAPFVLHVRPPPTYILMTRQPAGRKATSSLFLECALRLRREALGNAMTSARGCHRPRRRGAVPHGDSARSRRLRPLGAGRGRLGPAGSSGPACRGNGEFAGGLVAPWAADLVRDRRADRRRQPEAVVRDRRQRAANAREISRRLRPARRGGTWSSLRSSTNAPPFSVFGDSLASILGQLRFAGGLSSRRLDGGLESDVLAAYSDGSAGIVLTSSDAGALAVVNADLAASNLPKTSAFVPLLGELIEQMLDRRAPPSRRSAVSRWWSISRPKPRGGRLAARGPYDRGEEASAGRYGDLVDETVRDALAGAGLPGVYRVDATGNGVAMAVRFPAKRAGSIAAPRVDRRLAAGRALACRDVTEVPAPGRLLEVVRRGVRCVHLG